MESSINMENVCKESNWTKKLANILEAGDRLGFFNKFDMWSIDVNKSSGIMYLWSEGKQYQLILKPGKYNKTDVLAFWENEESEEYSLMVKGRSMDGLDSWISGLVKAQEEKESA